MKLLYVAHALAASVVVFASVMTVKFVAVAPVWVGVLVGALLYGVTLYFAKTEADSDL